MVTCKHLGWSDKYQFVKDILCRVDTSKTEKLLSCRNLLLITFHN